MSPYDLLTHNIVPVATIIASGATCVVFAETNPTALAVLTAITGTITGIEYVRVLRMPDPDPDKLLTPAPVTLTRWALDTAIVVFCFCIIVGYLALATGTITS